MSTNAGRTSDTKLGTWRARVSRTSQMVSGEFRSAVPTLLLGKGEYLIQEAFILLATMALVLKHVTQADPPMGAHLCGGDDPLVEQFDEERSRDIEQRRGFISGQFL